MKRHLRFKNEKTDVKFSFFFFLQKIQKTRVSIQVAPVQDDATAVSCTSPHASTVGSHRHTRASHVASVFIRSARPQQRRTSGIRTMNDKAHSLPPVTGCVSRVRPEGSASVPDRILTSATV